MISNQPSSSGTGFAPAPSAGTLWRCAAMAGLASASPRLAPRPCPALRYAARAGLRVAPGFVFTVWVALEGGGGGGGEDRGEGTPGTASQAQPGANKLMC